MSSVQFTYWMSREEVEACFGLNALECTGEETEFHARVWIGSDDRGGLDVEVEEVLQSQYDPGSNVVELLPKVILDGIADQAIDVWRESAEDERY